MNETWINELRAEVAAETGHAEESASFKAGLRADLADEWNGRPVIDRIVAAPAATARRPRWGWLLAAAAATVALVGGVVVGTRPDDRLVTPPPATEPAVPTTPAAEPPPPTVVEPTTPAPTAPETTVPATTQGPVDGELVNPLADWPVPSTEPGDLGAVQRLLPADIGGVTEVLRNEFASPPNDIYDYTQTWIADDGSGYVEISTNIAQSDGTPLESRTAVEIDGWDDAYFVSSAPAYANLRLVSHDGLVWVSSLGLGEDRAIEIARSMTRRPIGAPGWNIDETGLIAFNMGGDAGQAIRSLQFEQDQALIAELTISASALNGAPVNWFPESTIEVVDIDGRPAVAADNGFATAVSWTLGDGTAVLFGYRGSIDEALAFARTIAPVDQTTWELQTRQDPNLQDGCDSLFC